MIINNFIKYLFLLVTFTLIFILSSCGKPVSQIPGGNSSKWIDSATEFDGFRIICKLPDVNGINIGNYNKSVDTSLLEHEDFIILLNARYDLWREIYHFEMSMELFTYDNLAPKDFSSFMLYQKKLTQDDLINSNYNCDSISIKGINYVHIFYFNDNTKLYNEFFISQLTDKYYLNISAQYYKEDSFDDAWLASRRKIFREFVEKIKIIRPAQYRLEDDHNIEDPEKHTK